MNPENISDSEIITQVTILLDKLGPFTENALRKDKWRTTEQLTNELRHSGLNVDLDRVHEALQQYEANYRERIKNGLLPEAVIRRSTYPDRTTALPLWGSTKYLKQPWFGQPSAERLDSPDDIPAALRVDAFAPRLFLSHTRRDADLAVRLASVLAGMGTGAWMFETDIEHRGPIAACVRSAIESCVCSAALLTRNSIASLWVLTELHTALESGKPVVLIVDASDRRLLDLLQSVRFQNPEGPYDLSVQYDEEIVRELHADYRSRETESRADRYPAQVRDFLATLPVYLGGRPALAFPDVPADWSGSVRIGRLETFSFGLGKRAV